MRIQIKYFNPQYRDGLFLEVIEIFRYQMYEDRIIYHIKQAGVPIATTVFLNDAEIEILD